MVATAILLSAMTASTDLDRFLAQPLPPLQIEIVAKDPKRTEARFVSQTWQGSSWSHSLTIDRAVPYNTSETAILIITGDRVDRSDRPYSEALAKASGLTVVTLFNVPNQPLFGRREDDLIAHTFERFIETGSSEWPLLFPMTRSAIRAMDAVAELSSGKTKRFVVTGGSKRGWTSWLVGAAQDERVLGIAPVVFDNLRFAEQLSHQKATWGKYSEMIGDYTDRGLDELVDSKPGKRLLSLVDPFSYVDRLTLPKLILNGTNDRFWTVDAHTLYWDRLKGPKALSNIPNSPHAVSMPTVPVLAAFARACAEGRTLQSPVASRAGRLLSVKSAKGAISTSVWIASSTNLDFRQSVWREAAKKSGRAISLPIPSSKENFAVMGIADYGSYKLSTQIFVVRQGA